MSSRSRNQSYDGHRHLEAMLSDTRQIISRGISPAQSKIDYYPPKDLPAFLRFSGPELPTPQLKNGLDSPAESENYNFAYIGQIGALQRRKKGRKNFYKKIGIEREGTVVKNGPIEQRYNPTKLSEPSLIQQKTQKEGESQLDIEQLHYQMVLTHHKCKQWAHNANT